jgi:hypothetical protein
MTAYIAVAQPNGVHLLSDGAGVDPKGYVTHFTSKPHLFPKLRLGVAVTGTMDGALRWVHDDMAEAAPASLDNAIAILPCLAHGIAGRNKADGQRDPHILALAACWHPERGPALFATATGPIAQRHGWKPGQIVRLAAWMGSCSEPSAILGRAVTVDDPASFDPATDGLALMEYERRTPADADLWGGASDRYTVGGFVELTTIGPAGIEQRRLKDWSEDRVRRRIVPRRMAA